MMTEGSKSLISSYLAWAALALSLRSEKFSPPSTANATAIVSPGPMENGPTESIWDQSSRVSPLVASNPLVRKWYFSASVKPSYIYVGLLIAL